MLAIKELNNTSSTGVFIDEVEFLKWIEVLESGIYTQTTKRLQNEGGFCCLGVACHLIIPKDRVLIVGGMIAGSRPSNQPAAPEWLKHIDYDFNDKTGYSLMGLNDKADYSFKQIADALRAVYQLGEKLDFSDEKKRDEWREAHA